MRERAFCAVPLPHVIYAGTSSKEDFDRIKLPAGMGEWRADEVETVIRHDGQQYEHRCHFKSMRDPEAGVQVIFQWFEFRVASAAAVPA